MRVWDVGQQLLPHADAWARAKSRFLCDQKASRAHGGGDVATDFCDTSTLENVLIGCDNGDDTNDSVRARKKDSQKSAGAKTDTTVVSMENARNAVRSLRPEILRQAGARAMWRTGRVTAVLEQTGRSLNNPTAGKTVAVVLAKKPGIKPLIEVQDDRFI